MNDETRIPTELAIPAPFAKPREALIQYVAEVRRDLEAGHEKLSSSETVEQLIVAATHTHQTLVDHGQALGEYVQMVQSWRQSTVA
jgi:hypothetical protein